MKAYCVYLGETPYDDGCLLVFAPDRNKARMEGCRVFWSEDDYLGMRANRVPRFDKYAQKDVIFTYSIQTNNELPEPFYDDRII